MTGPSCVLSILYLVLCVSLVLMCVSLLCVCVCFTCGHVFQAKLAAVWHTILRSTEPCLLQALAPWFKKNVGNPVEYLSEPIKATKGTCYLENLVATLPSSGTCFAPNPKKYKPQVILVVALPQTTQFFFIFCMY